MENRSDMVDQLTTRVIQDAPLRELIRVYGEAVQSAVLQLSDESLIEAITKAGYPDILEAFGLEAPAPVAPEAAEAAPAAEEAVAAN